MIKFFLLVVIATILGSSIGNMIGNSIHDAKERAAQQQKEADSLRKYEMCKLYHVPSSNKLSKDDAELEAIRACKA